MSVLGGYKKSDSHSEEFEAPPVPVSVPETVEDSPPGAVASANKDFDSDLGSFAGVKAPESSAPVASPVASAVPDPSDPNGLSAMVLQKTTIDEASPTQSDAVATTGGEPDALAVGDDADLASMGGPSATDDAQPVPGDLVYDQSNGEAIVMQLLRGANLPQDEALRVSQDWLSLRRDMQPREEQLTLQQKLLMDEDQRLREREHAGQMGGGGGALVSMMSKLLAADPRSKHNRAIKNFKGDQESLQRYKAKTIEEFRDRIYSVKSAHLTQRALEVQSNANDLSKAVKRYNEAFLKSEPCKAFTDELLAYAGRKRISLDAALQEVMDGKAPSELSTHLREVTPDALSDEDVVAARDKLRAKEAEFQNSLSDAVKDTEIMTRNFPDKFDAAKSNEELMGALDQIVDRMPDPIAEEEGRKKMRERMKEIADGIRAAFDALINRVLAAVGAASGPKA